MNDRILGLGAIRRISIFLTIIMAIALFNLPYSYYEFLRIAVFICSILLILISFSTFNEFNIYVLVFAITLILWNPIFPIYMEKDSWIIFNLGAVIYYGILTYRIRTNIQS